MGRHSIRGHGSAVLSVFLTLLVSFSEAQNIPFLELLNTDNMMQLAQLAAKLGTSTIQGSAAAEKEILLREGAPELRPLSLSQRPSEMFGSAFSNIMRPIKMETLENIQRPERLLQASGRLQPEPQQPTERILPQQQPATANSPTRAEGTPVASGGPPATAFAKSTDTAPNVAQNPLIQLANVFLKGGTSMPAAYKASSAERLEGIPIRPASNALSPQRSGPSAQTGDLAQLPGMKDVVPGADTNFGIPKGKGCLPFLGEFMQIAYGNCVKDADERAYETWGEELRSAVLSGKMDLLRASRESCKRGAEREQCNQLRHAISACDIMESLQLTASLQRNLKRCEEISGIVDQNPMTVLSQVNNLINGEFASGFLNNFLG